MQHSGGSFQASRPVLPNLGPRPVTWWRSGSAAVALAAAVAGAAGAPPVHLGAKFVIGCQTLIDLRGEKT